MKPILSLIAGGAAFTVAYAISFNAFKGGPTARGAGGVSVETKIEKMAAEINKRCPLQVDALKRLDRVKPGPGKSYIYEYTIDVNLSDADKVKLQNTVTREALAKPEMKVLFDDGITVWYRYSDTKGIRVYEFPVRRH